MPINQDTHWPGAMTIPDWSLKVNFILKMVSFLHWSKQDEGSQYKDNTTGADTVDNAIAPGKIYNYVWKVPERAGPGPNDTRCLTWGYFSDVDPIRDTNTGLVGPLVICRKVHCLYRRTRLQYRPQTLKQFGKLSFSFPRSMLIQWVNSVITPNIERGIGVFQGFVAGIGLLKHVRHGSSPGVDLPWSKFFFPL